MAKNQGYDITGQRFGKLVVLGKGESKAPGRTAWNCLCACGNKKTIRGDALKSGRTTSCGHCSRNENIVKSSFVLVPVSIKAIKKEAELQQLSFGQYLAKEYTRQVVGGG